MKNDSGTIESAEMLSEAVREIVSRIKTDSDTNPAELEAIKKLIRKNVPFTMRGAFSAYILRALMTKPSQSAKKQNDRKREDRRKKEAPAERKPQAPKAEEKKAEKPAPQQKKAEKPARKEEPRREERQPREEKQPREPREQREIPEGARTLYVSVGRMKHLYPKQLSEIFQQELGITRDDIYAIRIHDKYSFITLSEENCEKAIEKITGMNINGRVASVSYSRLENKGEKTEAPAKEETAPIAGPAAEPAPVEAPVASPVAEEPAPVAAPEAEEAPVAPAAEEVTVPAEETTPSEN